jgi:hypothetical protein
MSKSTASLSRSSLTFLSLSRELRDMIYEYALTSPDSIAVCSVNISTTLAYIKGVGFGNPRIISTPPLSANPLALSLLLVDHLVSQEASATFYSRNSFLFKGDHNYDPVSFLHAIGPRNRSYIQRIEIKVDRPRDSWQLPDGSRVRLPGTPEHEIYPLSPHLAHSEPKEGPVANINPAIETIFALRGTAGGLPQAFHRLTQASRTNTTGSGRSSGCTFC